MEGNASTTQSAIAGRLLAWALNVPWLEILAEAWKLLGKVGRGMVNEGMYEVLEYESQLELLDVRGERAQVHKRQKVRYLQNNIIAYQDQAWGDGEILLNYRCSPGVAVDRYRPGKKTYILISLREVKNKGDVDEFNIEWGIRRGFQRPTELWAAEVSHRTGKLKLQVVFPKERAPLRFALVEEMTRNSTVLGQEHLKQLPDGRWAVTWESDHPRLYENYGLHWEW